MTTACNLVEIYYSGDGVTTTFPFNFSFLYPEEIQVALLINAGTDNAAWDLQTLDVDYKLIPVQQANFEVEFESTPPPEPTTSAPNVRIRRVTNVSVLPAYFEEGSTIRAQDLNSNFETLQQANEEVQCKTAFLNNQDGEIADAIQILEEQVNENTSDIEELQNNQYQLPIASDAVLGGIKIGSNLSITGDGTLSATGGGGGGGDVAQLVAGTGISLNPADGKGVVTITNTSPGGGGGAVGTLQEVTDAGNTTTNDIQTGKITAAGYSLASLPTLP